MTARTRRCLLIAAMAGLVLFAGASRGSAGFAVFEIPVFTGAQILFSTSGFSPLPIVVPGFGTLSSVIIRPVIIIRQTVIIAPTRVVVLSPIVSATVPFFPGAPVVLPAPPAAVEFSNGLPPIDDESLENVVRAPELFDHRLVSIIGTVTQLETFVEAGGHEGTLLRLRGDWRSAMVVARGHVDTHEGVAVRATGVFYSTGDMLAAPIQNVIAALAITTP